ncbi:hypothetical protein JB92DRAFT_2140492 [Gautieria morchelliformis]|nr:hypothetical protein JB92DRAFT_2140492 [Gautieria morchelliformis]
MYFVIPLTLASAVLGLPHQLRNPSNSVFARDSGACPGAPPVPSGAIPGDGCNGASLSTRSPAVSRRGTRKRQDTSNCQVVTLAHIKPRRIEAIATKDWGGDFDLVVNPPDVRILSQTVYIAFDALVAVVPGITHCISATRLAPFQLR